LPADASITHPARQYTAPITNFAARVFPRSRRIISIFEKSIAVRVVAPLWQLVAAGQHGFKSLSHTEI